ncbi:MAG: hypothetical protein QXZ70_07650 [Candidatus Bathyarchaeia archaeon]
MVPMGQLNIKVNDKLEKDFRLVAVEKFEARRGFLKKALEEAMSDWIKKNKKVSRSV